MQFYLAFHNLLRILQIEEIAPLSVFFKVIATERVSNARPELARGCRVIGISTATQIFTILNTKNDSEVGLFSMKRWYQRVKSGLCRRFRACSKSDERQYKEVLAG